MGIRQITGRAVVGCLKRLELLQISARAPGKRSGSARGGFGGFVEPSLEAGQIGRTAFLQCYNRFRPKVLRGGLEFSVGFAIGQGSLPRPEEIRNGDGDEETANQ